VARLAGMPTGVVNHARHALAALENQQTLSREQVDLFEAPPAAETPAHSAVEAAVAALNPDALSPREALDALYAIKKLGDQS
jgi:DNA mismatch repair protein MutS